MYNYVNFSLNSS